MFSHIQCCNLVFNSPFRNPQSRCYSPGSKLHGEVVRPGFGGFIFNVKVLLIIWLKDWLTQAN